MYKISSTKRLYSPNPIVEVKEDGKEIPVIFVNLSKVIGDQLAEKIVKLLNENQNEKENISIPS